MLFDRKIIDSHIHLYDGSDERALAMMDELSSAGIQGVAIQSLACSPKYGPAQNLLTLRWKRDYTKMKVYAFGALHELDMYGSVPYDVQVEQLLNMGCDGIKFLQMKPDLRKLVGKGVCHPDYDRALSVLEERGTPVTIHVADPDTFWDITKMSEAQIARGWFYGDGSYMPYEAYYDESYAMLDKHPNLRVTFAHFFFLDKRIDEARRVMEKYPNVCFDLTPHPVMYMSFTENLDAWRDFMIEYSDRIIYGTDTDDARETNLRIHKTVYSAVTRDRTPHPMPAYYYDYMMRGLDLPSDVIEKILHRNFERLVGEGNPLNNELICRAAERVLFDAEKTQDEVRAINGIKPLLR